MLFIIGKWECSHPLPDLLPLATKPVPHRRLTYSHSDLPIRI